MNFQGSNPTNLLPNLANTANDLIGLIAKTTFDISDEDGDGFIGLEDLGILMNKRAEINGLPEYTNEQVQAQMNKYDKDQDGKLNVEEYKAMLKKGSNFFVNKSVYNLYNIGFLILFSWVILLMR